MLGFYLEVDADTKTVINSISSDPTDNLHNKHSIFTVEYEGSKGLALAHEMTRRYLQASPNGTQGSLTTLASAGSYLKNVVKPVTAKSALWSLVIIPPTPQTMINQYYNYQDVNENIILCKCCGKKPHHLAGQGLFQLSQDRYHRYPSLPIQQIIPVSGGGPAREHYTFFELPKRVKWNNMSDSSSAADDDNPNQNNPFVTSMVLEVKAEGDLHIALEPRRPEDDPNHPNHPLSERYQERSQEEAEHETKEQLQQPYVCALGAKSGHRNYVRARRAYQPKYRRRTDKYKADSFYNFQPYAPAQQQKAESCLFDVSSFQTIWLNIQEPEPGRGPITAAHILQEFKCKGTGTEFALEQDVETEVKCEITPPSQEGKTKLSLGYGAEIGLNQFMTFEFNTIEEKSLSKEPVTWSPLGYIGLSFWNNIEGQIRVLKVQ